MKRLFKMIRLLMSISHIHIFIHIFKYTLTVDILTINILTINDSKNMYLIPIYTQTVKLYFQFLKVCRLLLLLIREMLNGVFFSCPNIFFYCVLHYLKIYHLYNS
jgi:hypothetical protein